MKRSVLFFLCVFGLFRLDAQTAHRMLSANRANDSLWVTDTNSYRIVKRVQLMPSSGGVITGTLGIARNPNSGSVYVVCKQTGVAGRMLGRLDVSTYTVNVIGDLGDKFSSITFRGDSLIGVTGNGAAVPESLFLIDTLSASATFMTSLGAGTDGEVICYNPAHDLIYHWSGNVTVEFESVLPYPPYTITPIVSSTTISNETFGAVYISADKFLCSNINYVFAYWSTTGTFNNMSDTTAQLARGLAFISCSRSVSGTAAICAGDSALLTASASPSYQWYKNGDTIAGATSQNFYATGTGVYNCRLNDACGTDTCLSGVHVTAADPVVNLGPDTTHCGPLVLNAANPGASYLWQDASTAQLFTVISSSSYYVTVTDANGCTGKDTVNITIRPLPVVTLAAANDTMCDSGMPVALTGTPSGGTYSGTGVTASSFDPQVTGAGTYTALYTYTDSLGCSAAGSVGLFVDLCTGIAVEDQNEIFIYPNPATDVIHLDLPASPNFPRVFFLYDQAGKLILTRELHENSETIDVSNLAEGLYLAETVVGGKRAVMMLGIHHVE
ncbi:MAG: hypothetical protein JWO09_1567 [Bacteroidetes bacterium]|nr:hypothetical protein [Bacteroidota bacterium]